MYLTHLRGTEKVFRRMKEEMAKQKNLNASLQSELDALQGTTSTTGEIGSRTRSATSTSGRGTPTLELETNRQHQKLLTQHGDLQKRFEGLQEEISAMREVLHGREKEVELTRKRAGDAEQQLESLREELERRGEAGLSSDGRQWEEVEMENRELRHENDVLSHKIGLLLDVEESGPGVVASRRRSMALQGVGSGSGGGGLNQQSRHRSTSNGGSDENGDNIQAFESLSNEIQEWGRKYTPRSPGLGNANGNGNSRRSSDLPPFEYGRSPNPSATASGSVSNGGTPQL